MNELDRENQRGDQEEGDEGKAAKAEPKERGGSPDRGTNEIATRPDVLDGDEEPDAEGDDQEVRDDRSRQTPANGPSAQESIPRRHGTEDTRDRHENLRDGTTLSRGATRRPLQVLAVYVAIGGWVADWRRIHRHPAEPGWRDLAITRGGAMPEISGPMVALAAVAVGIVALLALRARARRR